MNTRLIISVLSGITALSSCTVFSINPLYEEGDLIQEPALLGSWQGSEDGKEFVTFDRSEEKKFIFRYREAGTDENNNPEVDSVSFEAGLLKVGDHYFLDLYPLYDDERDETWYLFRNFIPTHSFLKIEWEADRMILYLFDYKQMKKLFEQNRIRIKHEMIGDYILITATTKDLKRFIRKYADDPEAFSDDPGYFSKIR